MKKHAKGLWRRVVIGVAVVWVLYGVAANVFIKSGLLEKVASPRPERTRISWENAWTVVPGVVHVRGFALRSHSKGSEWTLTVDRARTTINLLALPLNTLQIVSASVSGMDFKIGPADTVLPPKKKKKPGMRIRIVSASVEDVRAVTIGDLVLTGPLKVRGGLDTQARGLLQVPRASVESTASTLKLNDEILATNLAIDSKVSIDRHIPRDHKGEGILPFLVARVGAKGDVADLGFLNTLLKGTKAVEFSGGSGSLDVDIRLTRGVVDSESSLVTEKATYTVDYLGYQVQGSGSIRGFSAANNVPDEFLFFEFDDFSLAYADDDVPYVSGTGLKLSLRGDESISIVGKQGPLDLVVDLPKSEIPDLTVYNRNLKSSGSVQIQSGSGRITAHVEVLERSGGGQSKVVLEAQGVVISFKDKRLVGDLTATGNVKLIALDGWVFDPSGTKVELKNVGAFFEGDGGEESNSDVEAPGWWGAVDIPSGNVAFAGAPQIDAEVTIQAEDASPLFALFMATEKKAEKWDRRIKTDDLSGSGHVAVKEGRTTITDFEVEGGNAAIQANLCIATGGVHGMIHCKYGKLAVSAELHDGKESLHITSPKKWYDNHVPDFRCE